jgi:hypothetical protein
MTIVDPCSRCGHAKSTHFFDTEGKPTKLRDNLWGRGMIACNAMYQRDRWSMPDTACGCEGYVAVPQSVTVVEPSREKAQATFDAVKKAIEDGTLPVPAAKGEQPQPFSGWSTIDGKPPRAGF